MEEKQKYPDLSRTRRFLRFILFVFAAMVWLAELSYLSLARVSEILPVSWSVFAIFANTLLVFLFPALALAYPKNPLNPRRVLIALLFITVGVFWTFAPLYEYLALYESARVPLLLLFSNYVWEVPIIGTLFMLPIYRYFLALVRRVNMPSRDKKELVELRRRLIYFPRLAALGIIGVGFVGAIVGITLANFQLIPPFRELVKVFIDVMNLGFLGGILIFFILRPILRPWLAKLPPTGIHEKPPFPLRQKLAIIVLSISTFAFVIYVPVAYKHAQTIIGEQLFDRAEFGLQQLLKEGPTLENPKTFLERTQNFAIGKHGYIIAADRKGRFLTPHPLGFTHLHEVVRWPYLERELLQENASRAITHYKDAVYLASAPLGPFWLISVAHESDFLSLLYPLITKSIIISLVFLAVFALIATVFIRDITRPITHLIENARQMIEHRRPFPLAVATGDEVEVLADEFTEMAKQLRDYEEGLERKIEARTIQLRETNEQLKEKGMVIERVLEDVKKFDEELARLNRAKSEFISMASHQLRTPLTAIKWYAKILSNSGIKKLTPVQLRAYHQIVSANERMIELINALLNVSRIEMGMLAIEPTWINLGEVITQTTRDTQPIALERGVNFQIGHIPKVRAKSDAKLFSIVISNLISNALRYTPKGGKVSIHLSQKNNRAIIEVRDTGYGIPKQDQPLIFSKFFRASNILDKEPEGTGLGLYLTKSIIKMMKGTIRFHSKEGQGTVFTVSLPRAGLRPQKGSKGLIPLK